MLDAKAFGVVPGIDAKNPDPPFGGWACDWRSTTDDIQVSLRFDRPGLPDSPDGRLDRAAFPYPLLHDRDSESVPSDNTLLHNLLTGLVESTTLAPPDLELMNAAPDEADDDPGDADADS
ncbi:hypothetical protein [Embleya hyalina]|uniref:Uncharacterized protein n=1 Tax=Embleya hyalina TaxID=516124 RepID=A0A401YGK7_9ACTN|nr:hypothetical protein [Embleya hyalina]GCD93742.1 hypothetical protein EHYA_01390 [Embleya hyalina]